jgi:hypothetical protein
MKSAQRTNVTVQVMSVPLMVGDRVRLSLHCRNKRYQTGETGAIVWVSRWGLYHVRMDQPRGVPFASFDPTEVERAG